MKTFEEIEGTNYFHILVGDMKLVLEANEIIWENITWANFHQVFMDLFAQDEIIDSFKTFSDNRKLADMLDVLADAGAVVDAVQEMCHSDFSGMSVYAIDHKVRETLSPVVLTYVLEEDMDK